MNWTRVPILRGITEITPLLDLIDSNPSVYILGGYARYCASPKKDPYPAQDVDLFFKDEEAFDDTLAEIYKKGFKTKAENEQAITLMYERDAEDEAFDPAWANMPTLQLVRPQSTGAIVTEGEKETILDNFDFTVTRAALVSDRQEALVDERFLEDEENNFLFLRNIHCPISSTLRAIKYGRKGYWMNTRQCLKLFVDWMERDEEYRGRIIELIQETDPDDLTQEDIEELEALMRVD